MDGRPYAANPNMGAPEPPRGVATMLNDLKDQVSKCHALAGEMESTLASCGLFTMLDPAPTMKDEPLPNGIIGELRTLDRVIRNLQERQRLVLDAANKLNQ